MNKILIGFSMLVFAYCGNENSSATSYSNGSQFKWDFSEQRTFVYSFTQTSSGENKMAKVGPVEKSYLTGKGHLNIRVKENDLADLSLTDINIKMISYDDEGTSNDTMTQTVPATVVQDMNTEGRFKSENENILFKMIFPLPSINLDKGESEEIPLVSPFNFNGSVLNSMGQITLSFVGFKTINNNECAVLSGIIDISKLDMPEELEGEYQSSTLGKGTYYFDLENGYYVGSDVEIKKDIMIDADNGSGNALGIYAEMKSTDVIQIRLEKIEK